jgi:hypothetical protein
MINGKLPVSRPVINTWHLTNIHTSNVFEEAF